MRDVGAGFPSRAPCPYSNNTRDGELFPKGPIITMSGVAGADCAFMPLGVKQSWVEEIAAASVVVNEIG